MSKDEAIQAMKDGKRITHRHFDVNEWMKMVGKMIVFEDGVKCSADEFWLYRNVPCFQDGYSEFGGRP